MITHHTQLLNALIEKYNLKSYLEIGVQNPANNFDKIRCYNKVGVDPECNDAKISPITSDTYFKGNNRTFDLIFIDGLHHADQVQRDFENSLRCLNDNGFIVIHDVLPENEAGAKVPRETKQWWGDVYKWAMTIKNYPGIKYKTFNIDNGCMLIKKDSKEKGVGVPVKADWQTYQQIGFVLMNVTDKVEI